MSKPLEKPDELKAAELQKLRSESDKLLAEIEKIRLDSEQIKAARNWYSGKTLFQAVVGGIVGSALIVSWIIGYLNPIMKASQEVASLAVEVQTYNNELITLRNDSISVGLDIARKQISRDTALIRKQEKNLSALENDLKTIVKVNDSTIQLLRAALTRANAAAGSKNQEISRITNLLDKSQRSLVEFQNSIQSTVTNPLAFSKNFALVFGTDSYKEWPDLTNPILDAKTISAILRDDYGFEVDLVTNPTQDELILKLREYSSKSYGAYDQLFIYFAGHGQYDEIFKEGYLVCSNSSMNDPSKNSYVSYSRLRSLINNIPADHIMLTLDACFGGVFDARTFQSRGSSSIEPLKELSREDYVKHKLRFKSRKYMTSGGKEYVSDGRPNEHSPFTKQLIEALRSFGGNDRIITASEIMVWMERIHPSPRLGTFGDDQPGSDFLFISNKPATP